ncbi:MAG: hypothetical protein QM757_21555 [Paludibaculum sp.]
MRLVRADDDPIRDKFTLARRELSAALIEQEDEIDLVLAALVAGEHVLWSARRAPPRAPCWTACWPGPAEPVSPSS